MLAVALSAPATPPTYGVAPSYTADAEPAYPNLPPVYKYNYAVNDDYSFSNFNAHEERDGYNAQGGYQVALPDGRLQIVTYVSGPVSYSTFCLYRCLFIFLYIGGLCGRCYL